MKITKPERAYLLPGVLYDWRIVLANPKTTGHWDEDRLLPVKVGNLCAKLVERGLLLKHHEIYTTVYRVSKLAKAFKCRAEGCYQGWAYRDGEDEPTGRCPHCDGTGMVLSIDDPQP